MMDHADRDTVRQALIRARRLLREERGGILESCCAKLNGKPQIETLDALYRPLFRRYERTLAKVADAIKIMQKIG